MGLPLLGASLSIHQAIQSLGPSDLLAMLPQSVLALGSKKVSAPRVSYLSGLWGAPGAVPVSGSFLYLKGQSDMDTAAGIGGARRPQGGGWGFTIA